MKIVLQIWRTNPDNSNSLYTVTQQPFYKSKDLDDPVFKHYGWKHELPDEALLKDALELVWESVKQT